MSKVRKGKLALYHFDGEDEKGEEEEERMDERKKERSSEGKDVMEMMEEGRGKRMLDAGSGEEENGGGRERLLENGVWRRNAEREVEEEE